MYIAKFCHICPGITLLPPPIKGKETISQHSPKVLTLINHSAFLLPLVETSVSFHACEEAEMTSFDEVKIVIPKYKCRCNYCKDDEEAMLKVGMDK